MKVFNQRLVGGALATSKLFSPALFSTPLSLAEMVGLVVVGPPASSISGGTMGDHLRNPLPAKRSPRFTA